MRSSNIYYEKTMTPKTKKNCGDPDAYIKFGSVNRQERKDMGPHGQRIEI